MFIVRGTFVCRNAASSNNNRRIEKLQRWSPTSISADSDLFNAIQYNIISVRAALLLSHFILVVFVPMRDIYLDHS